MKRDNVAIDLQTSSLDSSSNSSTYINELNFDLMLDDDVRECIKLNNLKSDSDVKKHKSVLDNDPTPLSEFHKVS